MKFQKCSHGLILISLWVIVHVFLFWHYGLGNLFDARGVATVDGDNRFFISMEPGIILLAGGAAALMRKFIPMN